jgi:Tol biopolymer transport system component
MKKLSMLIAILVLMIFSFGSLAIQNGYDLFQKALAKERAEGNLEEAIALYKKVIEESNDDSLSAKAQYRIGVCYEKLGKQKASLAQEAFQKVLDNYPSQIEVVKLAKNKLNNLLMVYSAKKDFKIEKIGSGWWGNSLTSDGRFLAFVDWDTGDLAMRDLITGRVRRLTDKGTWEESVAYALSPICSDDGKRVAFLWIDDEKISVDDGKDYLNFKVIGVDGSESKTLIRYKYEESWISPMDWSPSGDSILALFSKEEGRIDLGQIFIRDGSVEIFKTIETIDGSLINAQFSPDGHYIVFSKPQTKNSRKRDIFLYSIDENKELPLILHKADDSVFGWSPDGDSILFMSDRTGTKDVWIVRIFGLKTNGDPLLVMKNIGDVHPMGFTQNGSFYYNTPGSFALDIYSAEIEPVTGDVLKKVEKELLPYRGNNIYPDWSPDGRRLLYISRKGTNHNLSVLCVYSIESGEVSEILDERSPDLNFLHVGRPRWNPDGSSIIFLGSDARSWGIYKVDVQTRNVTRIVKEEKRKSWNPSFWSPLGALDDDFIFYIKDNQERKSYQIIKHNIKSGKEEDLYYFPPYPNPTMTLSPDGRKLALLMREEENLRVLKLISVDTKEVSEIYRFTQEMDTKAIIDLDWSFDGRFIYFSKHRSDSELGKWDLWRIPEMGGDPQKLDLTSHRFLHLSLHPNGQRITFSSGNEQPVPSEIWVMRNLPVLSENK